jgi:hypothetical protein
MTFFLSTPSSSYCGHASYSGERSVKIQWSEQEINSIERERIICQEKKRLHGDIMNSDYDWYINTPLVEYAGKWIAIIRQNVVARGDDAEVVYREAKKKYPSEKPSLAKVPTEDTLILSVM